MIGTLVFAPSKLLTLGVELELQVLEAQGLDLCPQGPKLWQEAQEELGPLIKPEAYQSMIELVTPVCRDLAEVEAFFRDRLRWLEELAQTQGLKLWAASLHPFARAHAQKIWDKERYHRIFEELQMVGRRFIAQGLHIHLGMPSAEVALKVYRGLRPYLPLFLALTTSSPFYEGEETGLHSYRSKLFEVLPLAGLPRDFSSWKEFVLLFEGLKTQGIISGIRDLWWDIRIHADLGTVEIRVYDVPGRFKEILAVVALTQALAHHFLKNPLPPVLPQEMLLFGKWQAARYGLQGSFVDPLSQKKMDFVQGLLELLGHIKDSISELGLSLYIKELFSILEKGTTSQKLILKRHQGQSFADIIRDLLEDFWS